MLLPSEKLQPLDKQVNYTFMDKPLNMKKPGFKEYSRSDLAMITKKTREILIDLNVLALDGQKYLGFMIGKDAMGKKLQPDKKIDISDSYKLQPGQKVRRPPKVKQWGSVFSTFDALDHMPEGL